MTRVMLLPFALLWLSGLMTPCGCFRVSPPMKEAPMMMMMKKNVSPSRMSRISMSPRGRAPTSLRVSVMGDDFVSDGILDAVERCGSSLSASDLSAEAGCSMGKAATSLVSLAAKTSASLKVSEDGDVIYNFPNDFRSVLAAGDNKEKVRAWVSANKPKLLYAVRVSFGVSLLVSLFIVFSAITILSSSSSSDDRDERRSSSSSSYRGGGYYGNVFGPSPFDFFYYRPYRTYYVYGQPRGARTEMGFLESVFSYVFGDGDPNADLRELRVRGAAKVIRENGGAVTAEQLAPFADIQDGAAPPVAGGSSGSYFVDESFVVPLVSELGGRPEVTEEGDIIYVFEDLQKSGLSKDALSRLMGVGSEEEYREAVEMRGNAPLPDDVVEVPYKFSRATTTNLVLSGILGAVNLGGVLYLLTLLSLSPELQTVQLGGVAGLANAISPFLLLYAVFFNFFPIYRFFSNKGANERIAQRNKTRRLWKTVLAEGGANVRRKLKAAKSRSRKMDMVSEKKEIFDSGADIADSMKEKASRELDDFDKRLNG